MRLSIWSHPRSRSTALESYFAGRPDVVTHHEVLADYYYVHARSEPIGHARLDGDRGRTYAQAAAVLLRAGDRPVVHKDFPYHAIDELRADPRWFGGRHAFLVRDPREAIWSNLRLRDTVTAKNLGYADLLTWYRHLARGGAQLHVIDAARLNDDPDGTVAALCHFAGLPYDDRYLTWSAEMRPDWQKWAGWHVEVAGSRGIGRPSGVPADWTVPADLHEVLAEAQAGYAELRAATCRAVGR